MVTFEFGDFHLTFDNDTGEAITRYPDGHWSGCGPVPEDGPHAAAIGIEPGEHRLAHELAHHLVSIVALGEDTSPVVYRDAHNIPQPAEDPHHEEWLVTAITYFAFNQPCDYGALLHMVNVLKCDPTPIAYILRWLMDAPDTVTIKVF